MKAIEKAQSSGWTKPIQSIAQLLADNEIWPVALAVALTFLWPRSLPWAVGVAALIWCIRWVAYRHLTVRTSVDWPVALMFLMIPVALWATALPENTQPQVYRLLVGMCLFYAIVNWARSTQRMSLIVNGGVAAGLVLAAFAMISVDWAEAKLPFVIPSSFYERFSVLVSDAVHPNVIAGSLVLLLPLALSLFLFGGPQGKALPKILAGLVYLAILSVLFLTKSRAAWMAFGASLILIVTLRWRRGWTVLLFVLAAAGYLVNRFGIKEIIDYLSTSGAVGGIEGRVEIWSRAIYMVQDFPFTGVGMGSYMEVADILYPFFLAAPGTIRHAHNLFLQIAVDLGLPGLIAWLSIFMLVTWAGIRLYKKGQVLSFEGESAAHGLWVGGLGAGLLASQLALMVHGIFDAVTWGQVRSAPIVWAIWGIAMAASRVYLLDDQENQKSNNKNDQPEFDLSG